MNESGRSVGPARGALKVGLDRVLVVHDEIDLPFGEVRTKEGGGAAGHNGLKSLRDGLGSGDFPRVRVGVGRPDSTDPDVVAAYVLGAWRQSKAEVAELVDRARDIAERIVLGEQAPCAPPAVEWTLDRAMRRELSTRCAGIEGGEAGRRS